MASAAEHPAAAVPVGYELDDDPRRVDRDAVWRFLSTEAYWARWRTREDVERQLDAAWRQIAAYRLADGSLCGFARVISDGVALAYLADVFVLGPDRGLGLGRALVAATVEENPRFRWMLHTEDAHSVYVAFGFGPADQTYLERPRPQ
jgi:GNAT superfamily N-acetyltransferase